jgi:hypothetical protein
MFDFLPTELIPQPEIDAMRSKVWELVGARHVEFPQTLYHYTDAEGLKGIIESGMLRATHLAFMNDASEYLHAVSLFRERIQLEKKRANNPLQANLLAEMDQLTSDTRPEHTAPYFITCFSAAENNLNQWRAYGRGEGGFSIGFDARLLLARAARPNSFLFAVIYDRDEQASLIEAFVAWAQEEYARVAVAYKDEKQDEHRKAWIHWMLWILTSVAPIMKNPAFAEEREWRFVYLPSQGEQVRFRSRTTGLVPFVDVKLGGGATPELFAGQGGSLFDRLPITVLWSGPGNAKQTSLLAGRRLLEQRGYGGVRLEVSQIPYRVG